MASSSSQKLQQSERCEPISNECLSPWIVDNSMITSRLACRPPRAIRWQHKSLHNSANLSGSLPVLNTNYSNSNTSKLLKCAVTRTIGTQTMPSSCESIDLSEKDEENEKFHSISLVQFSNTSRYNRRSSDIGPLATDWHQLGKELRQIADELKSAEKNRSSSTQSLSNLGSSPDSGGFACTSSNIGLLQHNKSIDHLRPRSISACSSFNDLLCLSRKK
ncbi:uncharacterized protein LOC123294162 [Chrysoperla carnea]|uniref:uncharacterized protein LOC123294162 n=1 Tax=Chrysoperla carnea TaxID=189513 RepID=UPI001D08F3CD|nr:uncharacterized protein LOC123294162 [Chrysoperla carnea]